MNTDIVSTHRLCVYVFPFSRRAAMPSVGSLYGFEILPKLYACNGLRIFTIRKPRARRNLSRFVAIAIGFTKNNLKRVSAINPIITMTCELTFSLYPLENQSWHARCVTHFRRFYDKPNLAERLI